MTPHPGSPDSPEVLERIETAMAFIVPVARRLKNLLLARSGIPEDDLVSFGGEGALIAARTFDPSRGVPFERWARLKIRGRILDELRVNGDVPRRFREQLRALHAAHDTEEGALEEGDPPSTPPRPQSQAQTADAEDADARLTSRLSAMATAMAMGYLHTTDEATLRQVEDGHGSPEDQAIREELKARVRAAIAEQPERERMILENYYFHGLPLEKASGGLSRSWSSRLLARATRGVARALQRSDG